ncbi:MAG: hypothetical protein AB1449_02235 [Chloroflexota bacterium]
MVRRTASPVVAIQHVFWKAAARTTEFVLESRPLLRRLLAVAPLLAAAALAYLLGRLVGTLVRITL